MGHSQSRVAHRCAAGLEMAPVEDARDSRGTRQGASGKIVRRTEGGVCRREGDSFQEPPVAGLARDRSGNGRPRESRSRAGDFAPGCRATRGAGEARARSFAEAHGRGATEDGETFADDQRICGGAGEGAGGVEKGNRAAGGEGGEAGARGREGGGGARTCRAAADHPEGRDAQGSRACGGEQAGHSEQGSARGDARCR